MHQKLIINTNLLRKESEFRTKSCVVEKTIAVSQAGFNDLKRYPLRDNKLIAENADLMYCDSDNNYHCLLIYDEKQGDGILIESEGTSYARYTLTTSNDGTAILADIPVFDSSNSPITYTISEKNVPVKYVVPADQKTTLTADATVDVTFENVLKKFTAEVTKKDSENVSAQGDASLAGAVYGLYCGDERVATYTTDENGYFKTDEFVCGNYTLQELFKTYGTKYRCSMKKAMDKFRIGSDFGIKFSAKGKSKVRLFYNEGFARKPMNKSYQVDIIPNTVKYASKTSLIDRLKAEKCELCGKTNCAIEIHHVRKLKDLSGKSYW